MPKRTWEDANGDGAQHDAVQPPSDFSPPMAPNDAIQVATPRRKSRLSISSGPDTNGPGWSEMPIPQISRKIKACAACRRHKIKCLMDESGPPCRRCAERKLGCVLGKNLQSIIDEKSQYSAAVIHDLENMHATLKELAHRGGLPEIPPLQSASLPNVHTLPTVDQASNNNVNGSQEPQHGQDDHGPSRDNSPKISPEDEGLPYVPIHSLYALTKLRALRSPDSTEVRRGRIDDFISHGAIRLVDAERLFCLYRDRLDSFMYGVGSRYQTLQELRSRSTILTAATLTVAALHDQQANDIYGICSSEFRRLMEKSMFDRRVDKDYLRAMCVASYWLSDMSWMLSGYAIRRAAECNLHNSLGRLMLEQNEEAADCARLWYVLYICDQHLATLYGRPSIVQEDSSISGWESFLELPVSTNEDKRLASQVALLGIVKGIRDLFGSDKGKPMPRVYLNQITHFGRQLDQWIGHWSSTIQEHHHNIGRFPRKGALLHFHFAKLHLYSHVFRGLSGDVPIPHYFVESASMAVSAAMSIIDFIRTDQDVAAGVVGMPSYLHSMTAFACMFLIKVAVKYPGALVDRDRVLDLISTLVQQFRALPTGKWHLANLMAGGLDKMATSLRASATTGEPLSQNMAVALGLRDGVRGPTDVGAVPGSAAAAPLSMPEVDGQFVDLDGDLFFDYGMSFGLSPVFRFDGSSGALGLPAQTPQMNDFSDVDFRMRPQS